MQPNKPLSKVKTEGFQNERWIFIASLILFVLICPIHAFCGDKISDSYLSGYITAVLDLQFGIESCSVEVKDGVVTVHSTELRGEVRDMAMERIKRIEGVTNVIITEATPVLSTKSGEAVIATCAQPREGKFFPRGRLFQPLFGDPRWPHFSVRYLNYIDTPEFDDVGAVSFGGSFPFFRGPVAFGGEWDIGVEGSVFSIFDLNAESYDLINTDFWVAFPSVGYRLGKFSGLARLFHQSSHLGDEYLLRDYVHGRRNVSYEGVEMLFSYDLPGSLRIYGGGGSLLNRSPSSLDSYFAQGGLQFESPWGFMDAMVRPVAALDFKFNQESDWHTDFSGRIGLQFGSPDIFPSVYQLLFEYYNGYSPNGQFYSRKIEYIGVGFHYYY